ncbi:phosphoenolpyruvate carboxykinase (ATP) [Ligilactobacillus sp. WILCCON 0076]|uniref:phosphoenolpyruvate carboxykinase (ATP) n=1 Tax=Ligilactobacillus ubinensis TaxID=2876789 RepID=A0A9X2JM62_9LACO|nr:phosphoenolpyruvate carboxykinase (ATP) [Ligilactobacillus ubinensis]MCP0887757.1 phosphoenolpyruvate carboxykinase (ATP) [Ligilactobacillus ubinensis]
MSTLEKFLERDISKKNPIFSQTRTTIETAFYANNVRKITDLMTAYKLAANNPATIITDLAIEHTSELGLPAYAKMLVDNHGAVVGRTAAARHLIDDPKEDTDKLIKILQEAIYIGAKHNFYKTEVVVGLDKDFMLKAHLMLPEGFEMNLLSYMLNFQNFNAKYSKIYAESKKYPEGDIYLYADPFWTNSEYPDGLVIFDAAHNVGAILGLRYFGELKKATLTLAWATAHRNGYTACHGGAKAFHFKNRKDKVFAFYGLSGSGKSTLTHAKHDDKFDITVLHDDAFVISRSDGSSIALEPAYFDKTSDYLPGTRETAYFTTIMNVGVTLNSKGEKVLVTEDLRNGNGRTIKSRYASINRVDKENEPMDAIFWIMKDDSLPPILKLEDPILATTFGVTLATKRSTAENLTESTDENMLVIEPFADPFRAYPLAEDYNDFKELFEKRKVNCYIVNTAEFNGLDIGKNVTLNILESIVNDKMKWRSFGGLSGISCTNISGYPIDFSNKEYVNKLKRRFEIRRNWVQQHNLDTPYDKLPMEVSDKLDQLLKELK